MKIHFGYVSTAISHWDSPPSKTLTVTRYKQMEHKERTKKWLELTKRNLKNTF